MTYSNSISYCRSIGGKLALATSKPEAICMIKYFLNRVTEGSAWLDLGKADNPFFIIKKKGDTKLLW